MAQTLEQYDRQMSRAEADREAYLDWCEERGLDPDEDHYESFRVETSDRYEAHLESLAENLASGF